MHSRAQTTILTKKHRSISAFYCSDNSTLASCTDLPLAPAPVPRGLRIHVFPPAHQTLKARLLMHKHLHLPLLSFVYVFNFIFWNPYQFELCGTLVFTDSTSPIDGEIADPTAPAILLCYISYHQLSFYGICYLQRWWRYQVYKVIISILGMFIYPNLTLVIIILVIIIIIF